MEAFVLGVAATVCAAAVVAVLAWVMLPLRNRLEPRRMRATGDHGIALQVLTSPVDMQGIPVNEMLDVRPEWLVGVTYFFAGAQPDEPPPFAQSWWIWAERHGGEDVFYTHVMLRIQATQDRTVVIGAPKVHTRRAPVPSGVICSPEGLGGNGLLVRRFFVDLDDPSPQARLLDRGERESAQFTMTKGGTEAFLLVAKASVDRHEWYAEIPCLVDGIEVTLTADNQGKPFVTVGPEGVRRLIWWPETGEWVETQQW